MFQVSVRRKVYSCRRRERRALAQLRLFDPRSTKKTGEIEVQMIE
jgi:hypothetical protein